MILFAPNEHKYRFEVGYGLEGILPDGKVGGFGREAVPLLRQNNYDGAILLMTQRVAAVIAEDKGVTLDALSGVPPPRAEPDEHSSGGPGPLQVALIVIVVLFFASRMILPFFLGGASAHPPSRWKRLVDWSHDWRLDGRRWFRWRRWRRRGIWWIWRRRFRRRRSEWKLVSFAGME